MYKKMMLLGIVASSFLTPVQNVKAETLQETIARALSEHPSVASAQVAKDIALQDQAIAESSFFPVVTANIAGGGIYANNSTSRGLSVTRGSASSGIFEADASLIQPLFDFKGAKNRVEAAQIRVTSADYQVADARENLALQAVQAHIGVMQATDTLKRTQSYMEATDNFLERIQFMVDEGVADEVEAAQARNISLMLKTALTDYQGQFETALTNYEQVTGSRPSSAMSIIRNVGVTVQNQQSMISQASQSHPLIQANNLEVEALTHEEKAELSALYPQLDGELSAIKREQKEVIGGKLEDARALLKLKWDFETGGALKARANRIKAQQAELMAQNDERRLQIEGDIKRAYVELETAQKQMVLAMQREKVTSELHDAYNTQFEGAVVRLLQVMQSENQLFNSQLETITSGYRHLLAQYGVLASAGQLQSFVFAGDLAPLPVKAPSLVTTKENSVVKRPLIKMPRLVRDMITPKAEEVAVAPAPVVDLVHAPVAMNVEPVVKQTPVVQQVPVIRQPVQRPVQRSITRAPIGHERVFIDIQ